MLVLGCFAELTEELLWASCPAAMAARWCPREAFGLGGELSGDRSECAAGWLAVPRTCCAWLFVLP